MGKLSKYNKGSLFNVDIEGMKFFKLSQIYDEAHPDMKYYLRALILFNTKYGASPVAVLDDKCVNLPKHYSSDVEDMLQDPEVIETIKAGKGFFTIRTYEDTKYNAGLCYSVDFGEDE